MVLTAARASEARFAQWDEIDLANRVRVVPADRTKMRREHRIPLSDQATEILTQARILTEGDGLVFPTERSVRNGTPAPMPDSVFNEMMRELGIPGVSHGFRSSFHIWAREQQWGSDAPTEYTLGLIPTSGFEQIQNRSELLEDQRGLLQNWATFLETGESPPLR